MLFRSRYGRGAYTYQAKRRDRHTGSMRDDLGFHRSLPRRVGRWLLGPGSVRRKAGTVAGLVIWQVANAAGFALEALSRVRGKRPS